MSQPRAYRPALPAQEAASQLRAEARAGRLDREAVQAVLTVAGHVPGPIRQAWPAGLSDREVDVLRLIIRGLPNRTVADQLAISPKTVEHHVEHIYNKIGVSTRAGAALFAMTNDLVQD
jgi:DNA-binding NarL/FixJ family response regulator